MYVVATALRQKYVYLRYATEYRPPKLQRLPTLLIYSYGPTVGPTVRFLCKQVINSPKSRSKCEIRIWFRRPSAARSKCRKFEFNVSAR